MTKKDAVKLLIEQTNEQTEKLLAAVEAAQEAWEAAADEWQAAHSAPDGADGARTLEAADSLDQAVSNHSRATRALALHMASLWKTGYRLTMPD